MSENSGQGRSQIETTQEDMFDFGITDIEERLRADVDGQFRSELTLVLDGAAARIDAEMIAGLSPFDFERAKTIKNGLAAARAIVISFPKS